MKEFYTYGSEAYAPVPGEVSSHLPEDPRKERATPESEETGRVSLVTVIGAVVVFALFVGLLVSMAQLFEARSQQAELQRQVRQLQTQQDRLITQYEGAIDMDAVVRRAEEMGMHVPWAEQIRYVQIELPQPALETAEAIEQGLAEDFQTMARDMEAYFPGS